MSNIELLTDIFHTLLCTKPHPDCSPEGLVNRSSSLCYYYIEADIASDTPLPDHQHWRAVVEEFKEATNTTNEELVNLIRQALQAVATLESLVGGNSAKKALIRSMLREIVEFEES